MLEGKSICHLPIIFATFSGFFVTAVSYFLFKYLQLVWKCLYRSDKNWASIEAAALSSCQASCGKHENIVLWKVCAFILSTDITQSIRITDS